MDKYEYKVRADEIKTLIAEGSYTEALQVAETIDWRRVKSVMMLCTISDLYKINRKYEESRNLLLLAYERHPGGRLIVYSLCELSIKLGEYVQAIEYYKEFVQLAPSDIGRYVLQYKLYEAQEVSLEERITVLEEMKTKDYREKWAYELAYLYHQVGQEAKCIAECDEIIIFFGEGRYVLKALELKKLHAPLTEDQQEKLDELKSSASNKEDLYSTGRVGIEQDNPEDTEETDEEYAAREQTTDNEIPSAAENDDMDIQVKTVDVSQYNTINLQKELAESMKEFLENNPKHMMAAEPPVEIPVKPQMQESVDIYSADADEEPETIMMPTDAINEAAGMAKSGQSLKLQNTDELRLISDDMLSEPSLPKEPEEAPQEKLISQEVFFGDTQKMTAVEGLDQSMKQVGVPPIPVQLVDNSAMSNTGIIRTFHKTSGYDDVLSQDYDGQFSMVVPEADAIEKQITGQISIDDVLAEWERTKKENEQKRLEAIRKRVASQTDNLLSDFDESTKSGVLEQLEKVMVEAVKKEEEERNRSMRPKLVKVKDIEQSASTDWSDIAPAALQKDASLELSESEITEEQPEETPEPESLIVEENVETETSKEAEIEETENLEAQNPEETENSEETESLEEAENSEEESESKPEAEEENETEKDTPNSQENDKYKTREMTAAEKEQFAPYIHHRKTRRQIVEVLDNISMASFTGNVVITGEPGTGTITLSKLLVREVQLSDKNFSGKVAKISAATLNKKNVSEMIQKLNNGALIIEGVSSINDTTVQNMLKALEQENKGIIIIVEDTRDAVESCLKKYPKLKEVFNLRVDVEALDDQTLVKYAKQYALGLEYGMDEFGVLALHTRIADMQTSDHEVTLTEVEDIVDEAMYYANKKTPKHFFDILFGKRYDNEDMIILREKDFMHY